MALKINMQESEDLKYWILQPEGDLDAFSSPLFQEKVLSQFVRDKKNIHLDGERLTYIDSTGLGALIGIYKKLKDENCNLILKNINSTVKKLFTITELDQIFTIEESEA